MFYEFWPVSDGKCNFFNGWKRFVKTYFQQKKFLFIKMFEQQKSNQQIFMRSWTLLKLYFSQDFPTLFCFRRFFLLLKNACLTSKRQKNLEQIKRNKWHETGWSRVRAKRSASEILFMTFFFFNKFSTRLGKIGKDWGMKGTT